MRNASRGYVVAVVVSVLVFNFWFRGPFGILPYGLIVLLIVLAAAWCLRRLKVSPRAVSLLCVPLALLVSWYVCAPPTTRTLLRGILPNDISLNNLGEVRRWDDNWARDPAFHLKLAMTAQQAERVALDSGLKPRESDYVRSATVRSTTAHGAFSRAPDWWNPDEIQQLRVWEGSTRRGRVILCFDSEHDVVYLSILTI